MKRNKVKAALREGRTVIGTMVTEFRTPEVARVLAAAGFDFIIIDTEHSAFDYETVIDIIRAGRAMDLTCLVRVPDAEYHLIARILDAGAHGIMVPRIETKDDVMKVVQASKYPPWGVRGFGVRGIITDYQDISQTDLMSALNEDTIVIIQIEKKEALEHIDEVLSVKGVDVALIGPNDLSISLGVPGDVKGPVVREATQTIVETCTKLGLAAGTHTRDMEELLYWKAKGMRFLTYSTDTSLLISASKDAIRRLK